VRLLLDTHVWIWWVSDQSLGPSARRAIADPMNDALVSAASVWEAAIKVGLGKLDLPAEVLTELGHGLDPLPIATEHAARAGGLPQHHGDPFDRMLVAQAQLEDLTLVTRDPRLSAYDVPIIAA